MDARNKNSVHVLTDKYSVLLTEYGELCDMAGLMLEKMDTMCRTMRDIESQVHRLLNSTTAYKDIKEKDPKDLQNFKRILGEIAFQLDRRILAFIFNQRRLYGFTVSNAQEKIMQSTICPLTKKVDEVQRSEMRNRYAEIMDHLKKHSYNPYVHPIISENLVNMFGIVKDRPEPGEVVAYYDPAVLRKMAAESLPADMLDDVYVLIDCLVNLAELDGKPIFIWQR